MSGTEPTNEKVDKIVSDDEEEDIDQLIMDLQSHKGLDDEDDDEAVDDSSFKAVPEELLKTDPTTGLTADEVTKKKEVRFEPNV